MFNELHALFFLSFGRIIEPLASRCAKFRFKPLSEEVMSSRVLHICNEEGLNLDAEVWINSLMACLINNSLHVVGFL